MKGATEANRAGVVANMSSSSTPKLSLAVTLAMLAGVTGCSGLFEVDNPNQLTQEDATNPAAAPAMVNGSQATTSRAYGEIMGVHSTAADELRFTGSRDAWLSLSQGAVSDPNNEFTDAAFPFVAEARWMTNETVTRLEEFRSEGELDDLSQLTRAYIWAAVAYNIVADHFENFAFSDRQEAAPPIGEENMSQVYDEAVQFLDQAVSTAREANSRELEQTALAMRARTKYARALWQKLNPPGSVPDDPLVDDDGAVQDAAAFLGMVGTTADWTFRARYSANTVGNSMASWVNERSEMEVGSSYGQLGSEGSSVDSVVLHDPIDDVPAPILEQKITEFEAGTGFSPLTITSAREMHLILAEAGLAREDTAMFTTHVNHVRAMDELTPYSDQVDALELLKHERRVNLFFMGRRLVDHYRFGEPSIKWLSSSTAAQQPGTVFPITAVERQSNCHILGTC